MRLIDADALADALFEKRKNYPQWVADVIGKMPEVIARCKGCKWYSEKGFCKHPNGGAGNVRPADWFCADVERK